MQVETKGNYQYTPAQPVEKKKLTIGDIHRDITGRGFQEQRAIFYRRLTKADEEYEGAKVMFMGSDIIIGAFRKDYLRAHRKWRTIVKLHVKYLFSD